LGRSRQTSIAFSSLDLHKTSKPAVDHLQQACSAVYPPDCCVLLSASLSRCVLSSSCALCAVRCVRPRLCSTGPNSATGSMERAAGHCDIASARGRARGLSEVHTIHTTSQRVQQLLATHPSVRPSPHQRQRTDTSRAHRRGHHAIAVLPCATLCARCAPLSAFAWRIFRWSSSDPIRSAPSHLLDAPHWECNPSHPSSVLCSCAVSPPPAAPLSHPPSTPFAETARVTTAVVVLHRLIHSSRSATSPPRPSHASSTLVVFVPLFASLSFVPPPPR
jgi:hypothetical protein